MWEQYFTVANLEDALTLLSEYQERARIVAGATDLIIELDRHQRPGVEVLIDITRVRGLQSIELADGQFSMGALVTHNQVVAEPSIVQRALPLAQAAWEVGAPQIRNRATIAGNLITASPANDTIPPLWALKAGVVLRSVRGSREVALSDFYTGLRKTVMQPDELLTEIRFPALLDGQRGIFLKLGLRRAQAISVVNIAAVLDFDGDVVVDAALTYGSVAPTILQATALEDELRGQTLSDDVVTRVATLASTIPTPIDDVRAPAAYRTEMVKVLTARALRRLRDNRQADGYPTEPAMLWGPHPIYNGVDVVAHHQPEDGSVIQTTVNHQSFAVHGGTHKTLLDFLRDDCGLTGSKEGCAEGECGACTVFLDGMAVMACMVPAPRAHNAEIVTVEGLHDGALLHPIQDAFINTGAVQCGFCIPGFLMSAAKLLDEHPSPSREQILQSIAGNLCRCTGYYKIVEAVQQASQQTRSDD